MLAVELLVKIEENCYTHKREIEPNFSYLLLPHTAMCKLGGLFDMLALFLLSKINQHRFDNNNNLNFDQDLPVGYRDQKSEVAKMLRLKMLRSFI